MPRFYKEEELNEVWQEVYQLQRIYSKLLKQLDYERSVYGDDELMAMWQTAHDIRIASRKLARRIMNKARPLKRLQRPVKVNTNPNRCKCGKFYDGEFCKSCGGTGERVEKPEFVYKSNSKMPEKQQRSYAGVMLGTTTSDGVMITDIGSHTYDRMLDRGVGASELKDTWRLGVPSTSKRDSACTIYEWKHIRAYVNHQTGKTITLTRKDDDGRWR